MDVITSIYKKNLVKRYFYLFIGVLICACTYNIFILPYNIVFGGVSGISIIAHHFLGIKPSIVIFICSFILCLIGLAFLSKETIIRSIIVRTPKTLKWNPLHATSLKLRKIRSPRRTPRCLSPGNP